MWTLLWLGCGTPGSVDAEVPAEPLAAAVYSQGMWGERVLTVVAGLDEAQGRLAQGDADAAAALCEAVYTHSFEPELERLIRSRLGRQAAVGTEYGFGLVRAALAAGQAEHARAEQDRLVGRLTAQANELDGLQAVLTD